MRLNSINCSLYLAYFLPTNAQTKTENFHTDRRNWDGVLAGILSDLSFGVEIAHTVIRGLFAIQRNWAIGGAHLARDGGVIWAELQVADCLHWVVVHVGRDGSPPGEIEREGGRARVGPVRLEHCSEKMRACTRFVLEYEDQAEQSEKVEKDVIRAGHWRWRLLRKLSGSLTIWW